MAMSGLPSPVWDMNKAEIEAMTMMIKALSVPFRSVIRPMIAPDRMAINGAKNASTLRTVVRKTAGTRPCIMKAAMACAAGFWFVGACLTGILIIILSVFMDKRQVALFALLLYCINQSALSFEQIKNGVVFVRDI